MKESVWDTLNEKLRLIECINYHIAWREVDKAGHEPSSGVPAAAESLGSNVL